MNDFNKALDYVRDGLLTHKRDEQGHSLFCYSKKCFFDFNSWDDVTESHRGQLYYKNKKVNKPFRKIFNVNERLETNIQVVSKRMQTEPYEVYDKANGHLFIMSTFLDEDTDEIHVVFSTKGSLQGPDNDLLNNDIDIFIEKYLNRMEPIVSQFPTATYLFEAIVEHDQHTLYDSQVEMYGDTNIFVLLGINMFEETYQVWADLEYDTLGQLASLIGCPLIKRYDVVEGDLSTWKDHSGIEGYVIRFLNDDFRTKIKTSEYWKERFKKDLTPERILGLFADGGYEKLRSKLPEEVAAVACDLIDDELYEWMEFTFSTENVLIFLREHSNDIANDSFSNEIRKWLFTDSPFSSFERRYIASVIDNKDFRVEDKKDMRQAFVDDFLSCDHLYVDAFRDEILEFIN